MTEKVTCPYCGSEMEYDSVDGSNIMCAYQCKECGSTAPYVLENSGDNKESEARELALRRAEPENRVMMEEWMDVDIGIPSDDRMVLVWAQNKKGNGSVNRAYYANGHWHGSGSMAGVTHWMELPSAPEN